MKNQKSKYNKLIENADIRRWLNEISRGSRITADVNKRRLGYFCETVKISSVELLNRDDKTITDIISDFVSEMENKKMAGSYISSILKAVKSWLGYNNRKLTRKIKIANVTNTPSLINERVPTQEELKRIFAASNPRERVACVLLAHSGLRPEVLGNYLGDNGLSIGDFPELEINNNEISFKKIPTMIIVRQDLSKTKRKYLTFLGNEGCFYLKAYLEKRIIEGEFLDNESSIIAPSKLAYRNKKAFIRTINIGDIIRGALRKSGFSWRPYVLRSYFDTQLMLAESKGLILRDYRSFFMGHVGDIEHTYTVNKNKIPEATLENMRESYEKSLKFLETESRGISEEDLTRKFKTQILLMDGFTAEEIESKGLLDKNDEELREIRKEKLFGAVLDGNKQKVVSMKQLEEFVSKGYEFVASIPGDKAIIRIPK